MTPSLLVPFPDGVQLEVVWSLAGKLATNRIWLLNRSPPTTQAQLDALTLAASTYWISSLLPALSSSLQLLYLRATQWDMPGFGLSSFSLVDLPGGSSSPAHSANVSIKVGFRWALQFNERVNGNFVPGIPLDQVDVNTYSPAIREVLFEHYAGIIDAAVLWGDFPAWRWVCCSLAENNAPRANMLYASCIGPIFNSPYISQQRRRIK